MVQLSKQEKNKTKPIKTLFSLSVVLCVLALFTLLIAQTLTTDYAPPNPTSDPSTSKIPPRNPKADANNSYSSSGLVAALRYTISTDGRSTYATDASQLVYGGPNDNGGVDGANAATVLNAAITSLQATGGRIEVAVGDYTITRKINLQSNVELFCFKGANFILGFNGVMFEFAGVSGASLVGAEVFGNRDNYVGTPIVVKDNLGAGASGNTIANNHIFYSGNQGIHVESALGNLNDISFDIVEDTAKEGIMISRSSNNAIYGNVVNRTGNHGIISTGGSYNNITSNLVENAGGNYVSGFAHGIAVDGNHGLDLCYGNIVAGNTVDTSYMAGIEVADGAYDITVTNNYVTNTRESGIFFGGAFAVSRGCVISQNTLYLCGTAGDQGILVSGVSTTDRTWNVTVTDNVVDTAGVDGIRIKWVTDGNVTGNVCRNCSGYGLAFEDSDTDCILIANNDLRFNTLGSLNLSRVNFGPVSSAYTNPSSPTTKQKFLTKTLSP